MATMAPPDLVRSDRQHQIHSLHHPSDISEAVIFESGKGIFLRDIAGKEYIDGLSASVECERGPWAS